MNKYLEKISSELRDKQDAHTGIIAGLGVAAGVMGGRYLSRIARGVEDITVRKGKEIVTKKRAKSKIIISDSYRKRDRGPEEFI